MHIHAGDKGSIAQIKSKLKFGEGALKVLAMLTIAGGLLLLLPQTLLFANLLNIGLFLFLIIRWLMIGDIKAALSEVPFLLVPVLLIFLKHLFGPHR